MLIVTLLTLFIRDIILLINLRLKHYNHIIKYYSFWKKASKQPKAVYKNFQKKPGNIGG